MKLLVFSDSHNKTRQMAEITKQHKHNADHMLFLGDNTEDCELVAAEFAGLVHIVAGNCDVWSDYPSELILELGGKRIWMQHGHKYNVKYGYDKIIDGAAKIKADICLFGHTHNPIIFQKNGTLFLNPGSISEPRGNRGKSYAMIEIINGDILAKIIDA